MLIIGTLLSGPVAVMAVVESDSEQDLQVNLAPGQPYADVNHMGRTIRIMRNQNPDNLLEQAYSKTSRPCPPFCIQPIEIVPGTKLSGELELIDFLQQEVKQDIGMLVDVRMPRFYEVETIPGAVNIPFLLFTSHIKVVLPLLGVKRADNGWDFRNAKSLLIFCNGPWCSQTGRVVKALVNINYPADKLQYYRGGMQMWKLLGLSTISPEAIVVD